MGAETEIIMMDSNFKYDVEYNYWLDNYEWNIIIPFYAKPGHKTMVKLFKSELIQRPRQRGAAPLQLRRCWLRVRYRYWPRVARFRGIE